MENFLEQIAKINEPMTIFILCGVLILADILTGYTKVLRFKKMNASINTIGYSKKIGWVIALVLSYFLDTLLGLNFFLVCSALVCISNEGSSIYDNLKELGINLPFKNYFQKLKDKTENSDK